MHEVGCSHSRAVLVTEAGTNSDRVGVVAASSTDGRELGGDLRPEHTTRRRRGVGIVVQEGASRPEELGREESRGLGRVERPQSDHRAGPGLRDPKCPRRGGSPAPEGRADIAARPHENDESEDQQRSPRHDASVTRQEDPVNKLINACVASVLAVEAAAQIMDVQNRLSPLRLRMTARQKRKTFEIPDMPEPRDQATVEQRARVPFSRTWHRRLTQLARQLRPRE